jgi:integrase
MTMRRLENQRHPEHFVNTRIPAPLALESGYQPRWLLSEYSEHHWIIADIGAKPNRTIHFDVSLSNGKRLSDYTNLIESIKRVVYGIRIGPLMEVESGSYQAMVASNLITLAQWMIANQIDRFEDLTAEDVREYTQLAGYGINSILNCEGVLIRHIEKLCDAAVFDVNDTPAERLSKAKLAVPFNKRRNGQLSLARVEVLTDAGLGCIAFARKNNVVTQMLDEFGELCGFYQSPKIRRRMQSAPSIDELDEEIVTEEHLRRFLMSFDYLYRHRHFLDDALQEDPFPGSSSRAEAKKLGKTVNRTNTVPVKQAATLIERSIRWILDYAPTLLELKDRGDLLFDRTGLDARQQLDKEIHYKTWPDKAPGSPFPILAGSRDRVTDEFLDEAAQGIALRDGMRLPVALNYLMTACATVIAAFSARRAAEIVGLKTGCIERDETGAPWMRVFIHKTFQDDVLVPVPEVVASAISVLERISERARAHTGSSYIFQLNLPGTDIYQGLGEGGFPIFRLGNLLRKFGYFVDVPELDDGTRWTFKPHQFRRFFAILYIWIYELGDWGALSYHLRHFNPEKTRRYTSDNELGHIISIADRERTAQIIANAALGKTQISGTEGNRLKEAARRLYDRMIQRIQVVPERKFKQRILRFVERADVTLHALPWGYCAGSAVHVKGACSCVSEQDSPPDFGEATISTCKDCIFSVRTNAFLPYLKSTLQFHQDISRSLSSPEIFRRASETLSRELDEYIASVGPESISESIAVAL